MTASPNPPPFQAFAASIACDFTDGPTWAAGVYRDDGTIGLRPDMCAAIVAAVNGQARDRAAASAAAAGVYVLAHELSHTLGTHDQLVTDTGEDSSEADCVAWELYPWVAARLGITRSIARRMSVLMSGVGLVACVRANITPPGAS